MRTALLILLQVSLFAKQISLQTGEERTPPPTREARKFLSLVCPSQGIAEDADRRGVLACQACPSWTGDRGGGQLAATAIHPGHFTTSSAEEVLVATEGCEPHSENWGGSMLFIEHDHTWRFERYLEGTITGNCAPLQRSDGRTILFCSREEGHQSVVTRLLYTIDITGATGSIEVAALVLTDTMPTCGFDWADASDKSIHPLQKAAFSRINLDPATGDILSEVEFGTRDITAAQAAECRRSDSQNRPLAPSIAPATRFYEVRFHFDGKRLAPLPQSAAAMKAVQDQRADPYPAMAPVLPTEDPKGKRKPRGL